jgi:hypothetical protein
LNAFTQKYILLHHNIPVNKNDLTQIQILLNKGEIVPAKDILDYSIKYYDTFITILAGLLGFGSFLAYFYIKGITRKEAEQETQKAAKDYFEKHSTVLSLQLTIKENVKAWWDENIPEQEDIKERLNKIEEAVELIRSSTQPISEDIENTEDTSGRH